jgi:ribosome-associated heat shock protein Hsp15
MTESRPDLAASGAVMRVDKWLWFARLAKSRSLAARLCAAGAVVVSGRIAPKPNHSVRVGDVVMVPQGRLIHTVRIVALGTRRGPAPEARRLYETAAPSRPVVVDEARWEMLLGEDNEAVSEEAAAG